MDVVGQPVVIPYITELGNQSTYTPDFLVQFSSSNCD
ncbi:TnsA endonuclease N-terminal domain-containing protein, partial [Acinetobacter baumannii]